jgi:hypothetical protein
MADASELTSRWPLWFKGRLRLARALEGQGGVTAAVHSYAAALHLMDASDARGVRVVVCAGLCVCVWFASVRVCVCVNVCICLCVIMCLLVKLSYSLMWTFCPKTALHALGQDKHRVR